MVTPSSPRRAVLLFQVCLRVLVLLMTGAIAITAGTLGALLTPLTFLGSEKGAVERSWQQGFQYRLTRPVNILVLGLDRVPEAEVGSRQALRGRSDTILLVRVNPEQNAARLLSIPRDTQVMMAGIGPTKINQVNVMAGPAFAAQVISRTLNGVAVDRYIRVNTGALRELVDLVGGVRVFVPQRMYYVDQTQKLEIDLAQGWQTLNGPQAEQFTRFRDELGDIGRVQRQQVLLKALAVRFTDPRVLARLPEIVDFVQRSIDTNLSLEEMLSLASFGRQMDHQEIQMVMLPGRFGTEEEGAASYWVMDPTGRDRIMNTYFEVPPLQAVFDAASGEVGPDPSEKQSFQGLSIAVQNASGEPDRGSQVARFLIDQGFVNVYVDQDWPDTLATTQIIAQQGDLPGANYVLSLLEVGTVEANSTGVISSDLTIRVGMDLSQPLATPSPDTVENSVDNSVSVPPVTPTENSSGFRAP